MKTYDQFDGQDVVFVGLTAEGEDMLPQIESWTERLEIPWAVGYGAGPTLDKLEIPGYPTTFVIGRDGNVVWHSFKGGSLNGAIKDALNRAI